MPVYTYSALDARGKETKGVVNADSARAARVKLRQSGLFTKELLETAAAETPERHRSLELLQMMRRVRPEDVTVMTRQLATLLAANLTVVDALTALIEQTENRTLQRTLIQVRESVLEGGTLAAALGQHRRVFSQLFVNMVRAGEASGALPLVMLRLADFSERQLGTRKKITAKMYYPLFMVAIGSLVLFALLTYVVPTVTTLFTNMRGTLPLPTVVLITVSNFLQAYWWLLALGVLGVFLALRRYGRTTKGVRVVVTWKIGGRLGGAAAVKVGGSSSSRA